MASPPVPFLNRLVDQMFAHADPRADQNIWDLARAAEEVMRQDHIEQSTPAVVRVFHDDGVVARTEVAATDDSRDLATELGEVMRLIIGKAPWAPGISVREKVDRLIQAHQAKDQEVVRQRVALAEWRGTAGRLLALVRPFPGQDLGESREKLEQVFTETLRSKINGLQEAHDTLARLREILDPNDQFEHELLSNVAEHRMETLKSVQRVYDEQQKRLGVNVEPASAERLRVVLGASEHETLGAVAKRVREERDRCWNELESLREEVREWREGRRTTLRVSQSGRYEARVWDNNDSSDVRYGVFDTQARVWATRDVGNEAQAEQLARAWNQGER